MATKKREFLVEGITDKHVVWAICESKSIPETFKVVDEGSDKHVLKKLRAIVNSPHTYDVIGIMLDADKGVDSRWDSVIAILKDAGFNNIPNQIDPDGTILDGIDGFPKIGIWLMPDNLSEGMLEDFCHRMVEEKALQFAEECVSKASEKEYSTFKKPHKSKAVIHTYLSWQDEPGKPLGAAITSKILSVQNELTDNFSDFLNKLYA